MSTCVRDGRTARRRRCRARRAPRRHAPRRPSAGRAVRPAQVDDAGRSETSPSIEKSPSTTTSMPPPSEAAFARAPRSSLSIWLWRKARSLAPESLTPSRIEAWSAESRSRCRPGPRMRRRGSPTFAWWPVVKTITSSASIQLAELRLELHVEGRGAVEEPRAVIRLPYLSIASRAAGLDGGWSAQAEVVRRPEHDQLPPSTSISRAGLGPRSGGSRGGDRRRGRRPAARSAPWVRVFSNTSTGALAVWDMAPV